MDVSIKNARLRSILKCCPKFKKKNVFAVTYLVMHEEPTCKAVGYFLNSV